jgi:hypothetical protein
MTPTDIEKITNAIKSTLRSLVIATGLLYVCLVGAGVYVYFENQNTTRAICALRTDLELRTQSGEAFLKEHPKGIPGIPPATLQQSIDNQKRSIKALSGLSC